MHLAALVVTFQCFHGVRLPLPSRVLSALDTQITGISLPVPTKCDAQHALRIVLGAPAGLDVLPGVFWFGQSDF